MCDMMKADIDFGKIYVDWLKQNIDQYRVSEKVFRLPLKKHMLAQCMLKVSDMFYLSRSNIQAVFLDDVQN